MVMFWVALLAISILIYLLLDGFDLGVGILFGLAGSEAKRSDMLAAVAPVWDGNETWLVVSGVILWGAFPVVYATLLSAFYLPLIVMLLGLILRGVAFEFRNKTERMRWIWDLSFTGGLAGCDLCAGHDGRRSGRGTAIHQRSVFPAACSAGSRRSRCCAASDSGLGYSLLGACWLVRKCDAEVRDVGAPPDPGACDRRLGVPGARLHLCARHPPCDPAPVDRKAVSVGLSGDRRRRGDHARGQHPAAQRLLAVQHGCDHLRVGLRHAGILVLALHDPVRHHHRRCGRRRIPVLHSCSGARGSSSSRSCCFTTAVGYRVFGGKVGSTSGHY